MVDHIASQFPEVPASSCDDFAYSRWAEVEAAGAAAHTVPLGFSLRPQIGEILTLTPSITNKPSQTVHLMITVQISVRRW